MTDNVAAQPQILQPTEPALARLVQITDCHILGDAESCLRGMNTRDSFKAVYRQIAAEKIAFDALLATGDLSQDGSAESYRYLSNHLGTLDLPIFWLPGNHDAGDVMAAEFQHRQIYPDKQLLLDNWQVILLDSTIKGEVHGRVAAAQLDFLDQALAAYPDKYALICLHHQALEVGSRWIDMKGLHNSAELRARLARHQQVKAVSWGHVHQETQHSLEGIEWMSTPSTCIQFKPGTDDFSLDDKPPGYRILSLHADGYFESTVKRIDRIGFDA